MGHLNFQIESLFPGQAFSRESVQAQKASKTANMAKPV